VGGASQPCTEFWLVGNISLLVFLDFLNWFLLMRDASLITRNKPNELKELYEPTYPELRHRYNNLINISCPV